MYLILKNSFCILLRFNIFCFFGNEILSSIFNFLIFFRIFFFNCLLVLAFLKIKLLLLKVILLLRRLSVVEKLWHFLILKHWIDQLYFFFTFKYPLDIMLIIKYKWNSYLPASVLWAWLHLVASLTLRTKAWAIFEWEDNIWKMTNLTTREWEECTNKVKSFITTDKEECIWREDYSDTIDKNQIANIIFKVVYLIYYQLLFNWFKLDFILLIMQTTVLFY